MSPCPVEFCCSFKRASIPAKIGVAKLVPPASVTTPVAASRKPLLQLACCPCGQKDVSLGPEDNPSGPPAEASAISGTSRTPSDGIPRPPACHAGFEKSVLTPPPEEPRPFT